MQQLWFCPNLERLSYGIKVLAWRVDDESSCAEVLPFFHSETAYTRNKLPSSKQICFVCNTCRKDDSKSYNFGQLGKCVEDRAAATQQECLLAGQDEI